MTKMAPAKAKTLQDLLNRIVKPSPPLEVDGVLGPQTTQALKQFQAKAGLKQTGEVDAETAVVVARAMKTGKIEKDQPEVFVELPNGKYAGLTRREFDSARKKVSQQLLSGPVREARMKAAEAQTAWEHFNDLNKDQYVVSFLIETTRGAKLPPRSLIDRAVKAADDIEKLAKAGDNDGFMRRARSCAVEVNAALDAMRAYRTTMIDGAGNWVTGLEVTKWASFTFLAIYAAPVAAASLGTGAVASAMVGGAAVKALESSAGELGNWSAGNAQGKDPGGMISRVALDTLVGAVTGWLSKGGGGGNSVAQTIVEKITSGVASKLVAAGLSKTAVDYVVKTMLTEGAKKVLEGAVGDAAKALKSDPSMTWEKFGDNVAANFMKGIALGPLVKWISDWKVMKGNPFDAATTKKLRDQVEKDLLKGGGEMMVQEFRKQSDKLMDKYMAEAAKKSVGKLVGTALELVLKNAKNVFDTKALDKEMAQQVATPAVIKEVSTDLSQKIAEDLKKKKR